MSKKAKEDSLIEEPGEGHNSFSKIELTRIVEQIEKLLDERKNIQLDIKAAFDVAHDKGMDRRTIREALKLRALDDATRADREGLRDMYLSALGLI